MNSNTHCNQQIEIFFQKVEIKSQIWRTFQEIALTVTTPDGKQTTFNHDVLGSTVQFQDKIVRFSYCDVLNIRLDRCFKERSKKTLLGTFGIDIQQLRNLNKLGMKLSTQLPQAKCTVYYQINLSNQDPQEKPEQIIQTDKANKTPKTQDGSQNQNAQQKYPVNSNQTMQNCYSTSPKCFAKGYQIIHNKKSVSGKNQNVEKRQGKSIASGTITQRYQDQIDEIVEEIPIARNKNVVGGIIKVSPLRRANSMNVTIKKIQQQKEVSGAQPQKILKIRSQNSKKFKSISQLQDKFQNLLQLKYISANVKQINHRLSSRSLKLYQQLVTQQQYKQKLLQSRKQTSVNRLLTNKLTMISAILVGMMIGILF